jgi:DMSO/TMAO reductase YedYZ heme-binding membrane subunit
VNVFGISNDLGLLATLLLLVLLALSNTVSLRILKGKRWKQLQRLTYLLAGLVVAHTIGFQYLNLRGPVLLVAVIISLVVVLASQILGVVLTLSRQRRR